MSRLQQAYELGEYGHRNNLMYDIKKPYFDYCKEMVELAKIFTDDEEILCSLYCHGLLETNSLSEENISNILGDNITYILKELLEVFNAKNDKEYLSTIDKLSVKAQTVLCFITAIQSINILKDCRFYIHSYIRKAETDLNILTKVNEEVIKITKNIIDMCCLELEFDRLKHN